jgi:ribosomal protein S18 acetylase RimI-like enzyme
VRDFILVDLDQQPELMPRVLPVYAACAPGRAHVVCGIPSRMGLTPSREALAACLGVLVTLSQDTPVASLAICPYSDEQVTLWGPVLAGAVPIRAVGAQLIQEARRALQQNNFESIRVLVDVRNRPLRDFMLAQGFATWKDNHVYERALSLKNPPEAPAVRLGLRKDHKAISEILNFAFPDSQHCQPNLLAREKDGYRHYLLEDAGEVVAASAVQEVGRRSWLKLIATKPFVRRKKYGQRLLSGICYGEARQGPQSIGLEVLADNPAAIGLFEREGFTRSWTATVMTGPV